MEVINSSGTALNERKGFILMGVVDVME